MLSVLNWKNSELEMLASIVLRKYQSGYGMQTMVGHYDGENDTAMIAEGFLNMDAE